MKYFVVLLLFIHLFDVSSADIVNLIYEKVLIMNSVNLTVQVAHYHATYICITQVIQDNCSSCGPLRNKQCRYINKNVTFIVSLVAY